MNDEQSHSRSDAGPHYWRHVARSWRHLACWAGVGLGVVFYVGAMVEEGRMFPDGVQNALILMLIALAGLYRLDTERLQGRIVELESRLESAVPPGDSEEKDV